MNRLHAIGILQAGLSQKMTLQEVLECMLILHMLYEEVHSKWIS